MKPPGLNSGAATFSGLPDEGARACDVKVGAETEGIGIGTAAGAGAGTGTGIDTEGLKEAPNTNGFARGFSVSVRVVGGT